MFKIAVLPGDGIGVEVTEQAVRVLKEMSRNYHFRVEFEEGLIGGAAYDRTGSPFPEESQELCKNSNAVLLGAVGGPKWDNLPVHLRPEAGALLPLRKMLGLYGNIRPAVVFPSLSDASTLKQEVINGLNIIIIRELTGGIYFGEKKREPVEGGIRVTDTLDYTTEEIRRIARLGFETAMRRGKKLASVDKANVLESSRYWRELITEIAGEYPEVELRHVLADNCAMQLVRNPKQFDVIVTENMFGDILTDLAAQLTGSLGMLPSASIGGKVALFEPVHGSAPDIAGQQIANPIGAILSAAMLLRYSMGKEREARVVEMAVSSALDLGYRTADIMQEGKKLVSTKEMGDVIISLLGSQAC